MKKRSHPKPSVTPLPNLCESRLEHAYCFMRQVENHIYTRPKMGTLNVHLGLPSFSQSRKRSPLTTAPAICLTLNHVAVAVMHAEQ